MTRVFSLDHKVIGLQYAVTSMILLLFGFVLMMLMRWELAYVTSGEEYVRCWRSSRESAASGGRWPPARAAWGATASSDDRAYLRVTENVPLATSDVWPGG